MPNVPDVPICSGVGGNSISPTPPKVLISPARKWCFTMNNYDDCSISSIFKCLNNNDRCIIGKEVGDKGTPHLQGFVEFATKARPLSRIKVKGVHFIKCKGSADDNIKYCSKDNDYMIFGDIKVRIPRSLNILKEEQLRPFQRDVAQVFSNPPHDRDMFWYYGDVNLGKTDIAKYCSHHFGVIPLGGESRHMLSQVFKADSDVDFIIPLAYGDSMVSFGTLEKIKDGYFASAFGTECNGAVIRPKCSILVLANFPPDRTDRNFHPTKWRVFKVNEVFEASEESNIVVDTNIYEEM